MRKLEMHIPEKPKSTSFTTITKSWNRSDNHWWNKTITEGAVIPWWARIWKYDPLHHQMHILPIPLCWLARLGWNAWCASLRCRPNRLERMLEEAYRRGKKDGICEWYGKIWNTSATLEAQARSGQPIVPGRIIRRELKARGWTQKHLAEAMGRPPQTISEIVMGRKRITPETALQLAAALGTSAEFWMNLESHYRLHLARWEEHEKR